MTESSTRSGATKFPDLIRKRRRRQQIAEVLVATNGPLRTSEIAERADIPEVSARRLCRDHEWFGVKRTDEISGPAVRHFHGLTEAGRAAIAAGTEE